VAEIDYASSGKEPCKVSVVGGEALTADLVLVTVPLGVLKSNTIGFSPPLPKWKQTAIEKLGFGTLNKVVLAFKSDFYVIRSTYASKNNQNK
jgi:monoamine oxidase